MRQTRMIECWLGGTIFVVVVLMRLTPWVSFAPEQHPLETVVPAWVELKASAPSQLVGEFFSLNVQLHSPQVPLRDAEVVLRYSAGMMEVETVYFSPTSSNRAVAFDRDRGAVRLTSRFEHGLVGSDVLWAEVVFRTVQEGDGSIQVDCASNVSSVTKLLTDVPANIVDCDATHRSVVAMQVKAADPNAPATICTAGTPLPPRQVSVQPVSVAGSLELSWVLPTQSTYTSIIYGDRVDEYPYGVPRIPRHPDGRASQQFSLRGLKPDQKYYFRLFAIQGCAVSEASAVVFSHAVASLPKTTPLATAAATLSLFSFEVFGHQTWGLAREYWQQVSSINGNLYESLAGITTRSLSTQMRTMQFVGVLGCLAVLGIVWKITTKYWRELQAQRQAIHKRYAHLENGK